MKKKHDFNLHFQCSSFFILIIFRFRLKKTWKKLITLEMNSNNALVARTDYISYAYGLVVIAGIFFLILLFNFINNIEFSFITVHSLKLTKAAFSATPRLDRCRRSLPAFCSARRQRLVPIRYRTIRETFRLPCWLAELF